jgi:hypothetical protein
MSWFTVILLYPDGLNCGNETYWAFTMAQDRDEATQKVQKRAAGSNDYDPPEDFVAVAVIKGRHSPA